MERQNNKFNAFESYGEFLDTGTDPGIGSKRLQGQVHGHGHDEFINDMCSAEDLDAILKKKFFKADYPNDLASVNAFCPLCGKMITEKHQFSIYDSQSYNRKFLAHDSCLNQQSSRFLNDFFDHVEEMSLSIPSQEPKIKIFSIGDREFCNELVISHPLSDYKFLKLISKGQLNGSSIRWQLRQDEEQFCYLPNIICFPFIDFKITLTISEIGSQDGKRVITNYINLSKIKLNSAKFLIAKSQNILLQIKVHNTQKQKQQTISAMNYKYQFPEKLNLPIIELTALQIEIPEEQYNDELQQNTNSTIVQLLSQKVQQSSYASSVRLYSNITKSNHQYYDQARNQSPDLRTPINYPQQSNQVKIEKNSSSAEKERVDLEKLISTGKLSSYVRNSSQSRIFQSFLDQATNEQVQIIIRALYDQFHDLVTDEYANYMTQKLFQVCSPTQRLFILSKLYPQIPSLVRNKQGTHTIQSFISLFTLNQQFQMICQSIRQQFEQLCYHSISTHFVQKIIKIFPLERTIDFYYIVNANFLKFATDKNAMCVLKYMLRRIKESENHQITTEIKKHFINSITLNTDKIIQDCYGNYVVQFCYELFGEAKSSGITEMIIEKFVQFSLQKYSSSVVSKCINIYWTNQQYAVRLKDCLKNQGILQMYRNREGNKILLDLMDKNENTPLRQKIYNLLLNIGEASKFYHDRWGMQIGIRSGPVGIQFKTFTEADTQRKQQTSNNNKKTKKK